MVQALWYLVKVYNMMIPFNVPCVTGNEKQYILTSLSSDQLSGDGQFAQKCHKWFEENLACHKALLTTSCTHALEMTAILLDIQSGDEVIMPSYTFVSTANAFVLRGAKIIFVDIRPDTMNIDETKIEQAITERTKVIVPVHYAGVACDMDSIMDIAQKHNLFVVEDAAQAMLSTYKGKALGTIGHFGTFSFHETKNYTSGGEGGLLIINDEKFVSKAEIIREKGTNRSQFFRGMIDKYSWIDIGSSYLMNDLSAAYLWGQLEKSQEIYTKRLEDWNTYYTGLHSLQEEGDLELPSISSLCQHNGHMFYIKVQNMAQRAHLINYLRQNDIYAVFHYVPLHSSPAGVQFSRFDGVDCFTTKESERLIRLPMYYTLHENDIKKIIRIVYEYFEKSV